MAVIRSQSQFCHGPLQRVAGPVVVVPAQEPAGERGRFEALLDLDDGGPGVSVGRVGLDVAHRWGSTGSHLYCFHQDRNW